MHGVHEWAAKSHVHLHPCSTGLAWSRALRRAHNPKVAVRKHDADPCLEPCATHALKEAGSARPTGARETVVPGWPELSAREERGGAGNT